MQGASMGNAPAGNLARRCAVLAVRGESHALVHPFGSLAARPTPSPGPDGSMALRPRLTTGLPISRMRCQRPWSAPGSLGRGTARAARKMAAALPQGNNRVGPGRQPSRAALECCPWVAGAEFFDAPVLPTSARPGHSAPATRPQGNNRVGQGHPLSQSGQHDIWLMGATGSDPRRGLGECTGSSTNPRHPAAHLLYLETAKGPASSSSLEPRSGILVMIRSQAGAGMRGDGAER